MAAIEPFTDGYTHFGTEHMNLRRGSRMSGIESGLVPTQRGAGANMSVDLSSGYYWIVQTKYTYVGGNIVVNAAHASLNRWDIIYAHSTGVSYFAGTASATPTMPTIAGDHILIAAIYVSSGSTVITDSVIRDETVMVPGSGMINYDRLQSVPSSKLVDKYMKLLALDTNSESIFNTSVGGTRKTINVNFANHIKIVQWIRGYSNYSSGVGYVNVNGTVVADVNGGYSGGTYPERCFVIEGIRWSGTSWYFTNNYAGGTTGTTYVAVTMPASSPVSITITAAVNYFGGYSSHWAMGATAVYGDY